MCFFSRCFRTLLAFCLSFCEVTTHWNVADSTKYRDISDVYSTNFSPFKCWHHAKKLTAKTHQWSPTTSRRKQRHQIISHNTFCHTCIELWRFTVMQTLWIINAVKKGAHQCQAHRAMLRGAPSITTGTPATRLLAALPKKVVWSVIAHPLQTALILEELFTYWPSLAKQRHAEVKT